MGNVITELKGRAVEALTSARDWDALLCELSGALGSTFVMFNVMDRNALPQRIQIGSNVGFDALALDAGTMNINPRYKAAKSIHRLPPRVFSDRDIITPSEAAQNDWYVDIGSHVAAYNWLGGVIPTNTKMKYVISTQSGVFWRDPTQGEVRQMEFILKSFVPAIGLMERLETANAKSTLDLLSSEQPYAFLRLDATIIAANEAMEAVLSQSPFARIVNGGVSFRHPNDDMKFHLCLHRKSVQNSSFISQGKLQGTPQRITMLPYMNSEIGPSCVAGVLTIEGPEQSAPIDIELLKQVYNLTPAEADVANLLAQGKSTDEMCRLRKVSPSTLRSQILSLLAKTETTSRPELVALILRCRNAHSQNL